MPLSLLSLAFIPLIAAVDAPASFVNGRVVDAETHAAVVGARIRSGARETVSASDGSFTLAPDPGGAVLEVRAEGYAPRELAIPSPGETLEVALVPARFRESVEVRAPLVAAPQEPVILPVRPEAVVGLAGGGENVFRVLHTLPGVSAPTEFDSRLSVRGGGPDQNLTVMDGVEIHNPYRLFGLISAFNPETVASFELTAGAFSAAHGDRLSSLLVIENRAGTRDEGFKGSSALSLTDSNLILEGRLPKGSWLVTGRRTYYDVVAERFTDADLPSFQDLQGRLVWEPTAASRLSVVALTSRESADADFEDEEQGVDGAFGTDASNDLVAASLDAPLGRRGVSRTTAAFYDNGDTVDFDGTFRDETRRSNAPGEEVSAFGSAALTFARRWEVQDLSLRQSFTFRLGSRNTLQVGGELHRLRTRWVFSFLGDRNPNVANGSSIQGGSGLPESLDSSRSSNRTGMWLADRLPLGRLVLEPGLRVDRTSVNAETSVSPRLQATYAIDGATRLRGALGIHTQSPGYEKLLQSDYFVDLTAEGTLDLRSERARHVLLTLERDLPRGARLRLEGYYKGFDRLLIGALETEEERLARLARYDFPAELQVGLPRESQITTFPTNDGKGYAYGFDVFVERRPASGSRLTGWASYTWGIARREAYGQTYPFDYDRRHAFSAVTDYALGRKWSLSGTLRIASGFPRTVPLGVRPAAMEDVGDGDGDGNVAELVPQRDTLGLPVYSVDLGGVANLNRGRLPVFARLDARATFRPKGSQGRWSLYLDVINLFNRDNVNVLNPTLEYDPASDRPRLSEETQGALPFLPSFGVHFHF